MASEMLSLSRATPRIPHQLGVFTQSSWVYSPNWVYSPTPKHGQSTDYLSSGPLLAGCVPRSAVVGGRLRCSPTTYTDPPAWGGRDRRELAY
jgi:hypothetical protein